MTSKDTAGDISGERTDQLESIAPRTPAQELDVTLVALRAFKRGALPAADDLALVLEAMGLIDTPQEAMTREQELAFYRTVVCPFCKAQVGKSCQGKAHDARRQLAADTAAVAAGGELGWDPRVWVPQVKARVAGSGG